MLLKSVQTIIYTDASDFQLSACIVHDGQPVIYFFHKLLKSQQNYTIMEKEILFTVATLDVFQGMLLGADIHVLTGNKNLMYTLKI